MTRMALAGCLALATLGAVAVLDVGVPTAEAAQDASPFAGTWSGTWSVPERGVGGVYDWTISQTGQLKGTLSQTTSGLTGTITGHVHADGNIKFTGMTPSDAPENGMNGYPFQGTVVIDEDGRLIVAANGTDSDGPALIAALERV